MQVSLHTTALSVDASPHIYVSSVLCECITHSMAVIMVAVYYELHVLKNNRHRPLHVFHRSCVNYLFSFTICSVSVRPKTGWREFSPLPFKL